MMQFYRQAVVGEVKKGKDIAKGFCFQRIIHVERE